MVIAQMPRPSSHIPMEVDQFNESQKIKPIVIEIDYTQKEKEYPSSSNSSDEKVGKSGREAESHHKLEEIDLEINFNDGEILDGPETKRQNNGAETNRNKIKSIDNTEGLKQR